MIVISSMVSYGCDWNWRLIQAYFEDQNLVCRFACDSLGQVICKSTTTLENR